MNKNNIEECKAPDCQCSDKDYCIEQRKRRNKQIIDTKKALNNTKSGIG